MIKRKYFILIIVLFIFQNNVYALESKKVINPEWLDYMKLSESLKEKYEAIPEKYIYEYVEESGDILDNYSVNTYAFESETTLPKKFSLMDYNGKKYVNSSKKNQSSLGLCWAFGAIGSAESNMLLNGVRGIDTVMNSCNSTNQESTSCKYKNDYEINENYKLNNADDLATFSERVIDYITSKPANASAYNRTGTYTVITEGYNPYTQNRAFGSGASFYTVGRLYSYGITPIRTQNEWTSYNTNLTEMTLSQVYDSVDNIYQVGDYYNYPSLSYNATESERNDWIEELKRNIMEYGSVYVSTVAPQVSSAHSCYYYDTKYNIDGEKQNIHLINYDGNCGSGSLGWHAMQIIGWDDNYTFAYCKENNSSSDSYTKDTCEKAGYVWTEGKGAWILKNSWGSTKTYPYLSYQSKGLSVSGVREVSVKNYDYAYNIYTSIISQSTSQALVNNKKVLQKVYKYRKSSKVEYLTSFNVTYNNYNAPYQVYVSSDGVNYDLISEGIVDYPGLRTYYVDNKKMDGDYFYIKVVNSSFGSVNAFTKKACSIDDNCDTTPTIDTVMENQLYEEGETQFNFSVKTENLKSGTKLSYNIYNESRENITNLFKIDDTYIIKNMDVSKATTSTKLPTGQYTLKTTFNDVVSETDFYIVGDDITLKLTAPDMIYLESGTAKITPIISNTVGISEYIWESDNDTVATVNSNGELTLNNSGRATIKLTLKTLTGDVSSEIDIVVYDKINNVVEFMEALENGHSERAYFLTSDLDFSKIDFSTYNINDVFNSIIDGNYHILKNINKNSALFPYALNAEIKNIKIIDSSFDGQDYVGSLIGVADNTVISAIYNEATVKSTGLSGGIIGMSLDSVISECFNGGTVYSETSENYTSSGGIVGKSIDSEIVDSYNVGKVSSNINVKKITQDETLAYAGGIVGDATNTTIKNTYNTGIINATSNNINYVIYKSGITNDYTLVYNSYYLHDNNYNIVDENLERTLDELKNKSTYLNWDFNNVWKIVEGKSTPILRKYPVEVKNIDFNIFSKTLNTNYTYDFSYEVLPLGSSGDVQIISGDESLFIVNNNQIITKNKEGSSYITFKVEGKEYSFPITITNFFNIEYDKTLTGTKLDINVNYNYYMSKLNDEYIKLVYNVDGVDKEKSFEKNVISDKYNFTVYNNGTVSLKLYLCNTSCELKYENSIKINNIDKTRPVIKYETNNILKTIKISVSDENGLSSNNDYIYGLSNSKNIIPTNFYKYKNGVKFSDLSLNNENKYLWIKRVYDSSGNPTCDSLYCVYKLNLENNYYYVYYYDENQTTLLKKEKYLENTLLNLSYKPVKDSTIDFDYEFDYWVGYNKNMKLVGNINLYAKYKKYYRGISSYNYVIENMIIKEIKGKNINTKYSLDEFKSNIITNDTYNFYDTNNKILDIDYIKTGMLYKSSYRTYKIALAGDVTGDGVVKMNDVMKIANHIVNGNVLTDEYYVAGDVTGDGVVKMNDVMKIASGIVNGGSL